MSNSKSDHDHKLKVIGAGLMRNGTLSLKIALEILFPNPCYHMQTVLKNPKHCSFWIKALSDDTSITKDEWHQFLHDFSAGVDVPFCLFYQELMEVYPDAKIILATRDPRAWAKSVGDTIYHSYHRFNLGKNIVWSIFLRLTGQGKMREFYVKTMSKCLGIADSTADLLKNEEFLVQRYIEWNEKVIQTVPKDRLLIFEMKNQGWEPLCNFLNVPVPKVPYPRVNSTDEFLKRIQKATVIAQISVYGTAALIVAGIAFLWNYWYY